jgi:hypothetical protein
MPLAIHFGVRDSEFDVLRNQIIRLVPMGIDLVKEPDAWDCRYTDTVLDEPVHVTIRTMTPMVVMHFLASHFDNFLLPRSGEEFDGVKILVTDTLDNGDPNSLGTVQEYVELRYPE